MKLSPPRWTEAQKRQLCLDFEALCLRRIFERALQASLASTLVLAGCTASTASRDLLQPPEKPAPVVEGSEMPLCDSTVGAWQLASGLHLVREVDYVADRVGDNVISEQGAACATARNRERCEEDLLLDAGASRQLVTTEGDDVRLWTMPGALNVLGDIDSAAEALWVASAQGYVIDCSGKVTAQDGRFAIEPAARDRGQCAESWKGQVEVDAAGDVIEGEGVTTPPTCSIGRRPEGLRSQHAPHSRSRLGEHFAHVAHLEAASVPAFAAIERELRAHGAPQYLQRAARAARHDEIRHARSMAALARRFGARASAPRVQACGVRDLRAFALDNAIEGCVNETFAALVASHQALHAQDPQIRAALRVIARDETRHAHLSWQLARWATPQLGRAQQREIAARQRHAVAELGEQLSAAVDPLLCRIAGLPNAGEAQLLHARLTRSLWS